MKFRAQPYCGQIQAGTEWVIYLWESSWEFEPLVYTERRRKMDDSRIAPKLESDHKLQASDT